MLDTYLHYIHHEAYILGDKTISIDLHKFESGESNKLLVIGLSGAGKSTLGGYLGKKYNCIYYDTDDCPKAKKEWVNKVGDEKAYTPLSNDFIKKCYKWCLTDILNNNKKMVIAGGFIYQSYYLSPKARKLLNTLPVIILGKSVIKSSIDKTKRSLRKNKYKGVPINTKLKKLYQSLYLNMEILQKQINYYKKGRISHNSIIKDFGVPKL